MVTGFNKWLLFLLLPAALYTRMTPFDMPALNPPHPLHVSVTEINHNETDKTLEISCKMFTDDFERILTQQYKTKVDLINPPDRAAMEKIVSDFILRHVSIKTDGRPAKLIYLGYEKDNDAIYSYFQADDIKAVKKLEISTNIFHDLFTDQINLVHVIVGGKRKSYKLDYPQKDAQFNF
ncbi:MAG: hypothetical protein EOO02_14300 [Chitinophagaceae bacterium]|nr:MAG: hypothetical protein EOO02_14300 [Chitinophagaceae bacterium]